MISILIEQQESLLMEEIQEKQNQLEKLRELQSTVQNKRIPSHLNPLRT